MLDKKVYESLRRINKKEELPEDTVFYSNDYYKRGATYQSWVTLYNKDFEELEKVKMGFSTAFGDLQQITSEANSRDMVATAFYKLEDCGNGFYKMSKNEYCTKEFLTTATRSFNTFK